MAAKKKSEEKTSKKSKSTKKSKSAKKIKLTFAPVMGAGKEFTALLRKKTMKSVYGREEPVYSPAIDGLPMELTVKKGEVIEVTQEQLDELRNRGHVETEEEYKSRQHFIKSMNPQHPETLNWDMIIAEGYNFSTLLDSQNIVYNDKLLIVD